MAQQQPPVEKFSFKDQVNAVNWIMNLASLTLIVIMRRDCGFRFLNSFHLIGTALGLLVICSLTQEPDYRPIDLAIFALAMLATAFGQKFRRWREIGKANPEHSYYMGTSCFQFRWLPRFLKRNRRMARFFDPLFCFCVGLIFATVSHALGLWVMFAALCLRFVEYRAWQNYLMMQLDIGDGTADAEMHSRIVDKLTTPTAQMRTQQQGAEAISTGMGDDIQEKIKRRKQAQKPPPDSNPAL